MIPDFGSPSGNAIFGSYQYRLSWRKGLVINTIAHPVFLPIWCIFCYLVFSNTGSFWLWLPALLSLYFALKLFHRYRLIENTARSSVSSSAQGYVELEGQAWLPEGEAFRGPSQLPVMVWLPGYIDDQPFYLEDHAGRCLLYPGEAEVVARPGDNHLLQVPAIYPGQTIYVLGDMRTFGGENMPITHSELVSSHLQQWKSNPRNLLEQFDHNNNGQLDRDEWEQVVQSAKRLATEDLQEKRQQPGSHIIDRSEGGRLFLISNISPDRLAVQYRLACWFYTGSWLLLLTIFYLYRDHPAY